MIVFFWDEHTTLFSFLVVSTSSSPIRSTEWWGYSSKALLSERAFLFAPYGAVFKVGIHPSSFSGFFSRKYWLRHIRHAHLSARLLTAATEKAITFGGGCLGFGDASLVGFALL